jgi:hypothetical protein
MCAHDVTGTDCDPKGWQLPFRLDAVRRLLHPNAQALTSKQVGIGHAS